MSLDIRYLTNGEKEIIRVLNTGARPFEMSFYDKREDVPHSIRHYVPEKAQKVSPHLAYHFGCGKVLYPQYDFKCKRTEYQDKRCVIDACRYWDVEKDCCSYKGEDEEE